MKTNDNVNYLTYDQAMLFVDRIENRCRHFNYEMCETEKEAMARLLSDIGIKTSDLVDESYLADNYAINAEIVDASEAHNYSHSDLEDALFSWHDNNGDRCYCLSW